MSELKTLKDFLACEVHAHEYMGLESEEKINTHCCKKEDLKKEAIKHIKGIQSGSGVKRDEFPDSMKGRFPKQKWNDGIFTLGIEYGFIIGLMEFCNITEEDLMTNKEVNAKEHGEIGNN